MTCRLPAAAGRGPEVGPCARIAEFRLKPRRISRSLSANGPGLPSPVGTPSISATGTARFAAEVMNASEACCASLIVNGRSSTAICDSERAFGTESARSDCRVPAEIKMDFPQPVGERPWPAFACRHPVDFDDGNRQVRSRSDERLGGLLRLLDCERPPLDRHLRFGTGLRDGGPRVQIAEFRLKSR